MERSILALLEQHDSLAYEQIAVQVDKPPNIVRSLLSELRASGFVDLLSFGEFEAHTTNASYWRLTDAGRSELARRRLVGNL
jgi:predicted ArsR family transcriptional regulator